MNNCVGLMHFIYHCTHAFPNTRCFLLNTACCDLFFLTLHILLENNILSISIPSTSVKVLILFCN